jgi:hypothetical protein
MNFINNELNNSATQYNVYITLECTLINIIINKV